nr:MAG TPA: hypothetical protein [Myoviridae sp. ctNqw6]
MFIVNAHDIFYPENVTAPYYFSPILLHTPKTD